MDSSQQNEESKKNKINICERRYYKSQAVRISKLSLTIINNKCIRGNFRSEFSALLVESSMKDKSPLFWKSMRKNL